MPIDFFNAVENLIRKAPAVWMNAACETLRTLPAAALSESVLKSLPPTNNSDLPFLIAQVIKNAANRMTWEALSWSLQSAFDIYRRREADQHIELLWSGPSPNHKIPARRIDQALYDLIAGAKREILLITFAAAKIERLIRELSDAKRRGVHVRLILEFEQSSEGQLSYDALKAFPESLIAGIEVFYWPLEQRERNQVGKPGKLHAKLAIIDDVALVSSANLTDDAFNRNLEIGVMIKNQDFLLTAENYIESLIAEKKIHKFRR